MYRITVADVAAAYADVAPGAADPALSLCVAVLDRHAGQSDRRYWCGFLHGACRVFLPDHDPLSGPFRAGYVDGRAARKWLRGRRTA